MLPFLKRHNQAGATVTYRKPDENSEVSQEGSPIEACAQDIISAMDGKDAKALARAIEAAFEILSSAPEAPEAEG